MIDTRQYEWADLSFNLAGRDLTGFRAIKYKSKQEKELLYGKGNEPLSIQKGNKGYDGEVTLLRSELETLRALGGGSILSLHIDGVVAYGNPSNGDVITTDKIFGLEFTEDGNEMKQGDKFEEISLPFIALKIKYQNP